MTNLKLAKRFVKEQVIISVLGNNKYQNWGASMNLPRIRI